MQSIRRSCSVLACAGVAASLVLTAGCGSDSADKGNEGTKGKTVITVANTPSDKPDPAPRKQFLDDVAAFEAAHPDIDIKPTDYWWGSDTFAPRLAAGQLETVFKVPLTEPTKLISQHQVADITDAVAAVPELKDLNPRLLSVGQRDGKTYGIPTEAYAIGMLYNRDLFSKAGLDPDKPPTTWDEVRTYSQKIAALGNGISGFNMITMNNFGGWTLTMMNASYGNDMEVQKDGKYVANFQNDAGVAALSAVQAMRWQDNSMGSKALQNLDDIQKAMAAGKVGMVLGAGDWLTGIVATYGGKKESYGMGPMPQAGGNATLTGGAMAMVNPKATAAQREAAAQWIAFEYLNVYLDKDQTAKYFQAQAKVKNAAIGYPSLPLFNDQIQQQYYEARKPYVNLPTANYRTYEAALSTLSFKPEPPIDAQNVYKQLDAVVQQVLTQRGTDVRAALQKTAGQVDTLLARTQR